MSILRILLVTALLCLFVSIAAAAETQGPAASIRMLQQAIDTNSTEMLNTYMDVDQVTDKAARAAINDPAAMRAAQQNPVAALIIAGLGSDAKGKQALQQILRQESKSFIQYGVSSGAFAGKLQKKASKDAGLLSPLLGNASKGRKVFGETSVLEQKGDAAKVKTSLYDAGNKETYPLELRLERQKGIWRVTELLNIRQLSARFQ